MMEILRIVLVSVTGGWFCWFLGNTIIDGIRTGAIRHTDSTSMCRRKTNPVGFWALVVLFTAFVALVAWKCGSAVVDSVKSLMR